MSSRQPASCHYGQCDSYFVEHEADRLFAPASRPMVILDQIKASPEERQRELASRLSALATTELLDDVLGHMEFMEGETLPDVASIDIQTEIQWFMRPYLLDFIIEAHASFKLLPETLFLAVNLLDRYCSRRVVYKRHYQLVGCAALLIAAKYGDVKENIPTVRELRAMCCGLYDDDMFTQMEWHVLQTLDWTVGAPTVDAFLKVALVDSHEHPQVEHMAMYISELALFHKEFVSIRPSVMARSALALAHAILGSTHSNPDSWGADYDSFTMVSLSRQLYNPSPIVCRKYSSQHMSAVAMVVDDFLTRQAFIARNYCPPTPPAETGMAGVGTAVQQKPDAHLHTPQKGQYPIMPHGVPTPPITPEGEHFGAMDVRNYGMPSEYPATPCPLPVGVESQQHTYACGL